MTNFQLKIQKNGEEVFEFIFCRNTPASDLNIERSEIVRLMDEATDALMRQPQKMECEQLEPPSPVHRIRIYAGGDAVNK